FKVTEEEKSENVPKHVGIFKVTDEEKTEEAPKQAGIFKINKGEENSEPVPIFKNSDDFDVSSILKSAAVEDDASDIIKNAAAEEDDIPVFKPSANLKPVRHHFEKADEEIPQEVQHEEVEIPEEEFGGSSDIADNPKLKKYIEKLKKFKPTQECVSGAIVMNCNPFTLGHQYLIEECSRKCDILYVFVVEEDKSTFSFKDRFELVKQGTSHIKNVRVMPSGSFMISTITFPEYFTKDAPSETVVDPSSDVELFAAHIAPALGINIRFAGEEPLDKVTKQYNDTMRKILPAYGIKFEVIERLRNGGKPISASQVRKYLEEGKFDEIIKIVPETTYSYLEKLKKKES
ncbi:MAG: adenylyltransferase/cytidyltransferase family protein, partial [Firmicutes bacterium]|nr:adenylyltransferase/cytidyltransferase family protein [Bacillota bacterium]